MLEIDAIETYYGESHILFDLLLGQVGKSVPHPSEQLEPLGTSGLELRETFEILGGDQRRHRNPALFDEDARLTPKDPIEQLTEVFSRLRGFHGLD